MKNDAQGLVGRRPPYLFMDEVADLLNRASKANGWTTRSVREFLAARGAAEQLPPSAIRRTARRQWVTTREKLREAFPVLYETILRSSKEDDLDGPPSSHVGTT